MFEIPTEMHSLEPARELRDATVENDVEFQHKSLRFSPAKNKHAGIHSLSTHLSRMDSSILIIRKSPFFTLGMAG